MMNSKIEKLSVQKNFVAEEIIPKWWKGLAIELQCDIESIQTGIILEANRDVMGPRGLTHLFGDKNGRR